MKYLQYFETTAAFNAKYNSINYYEPWTSWDNQTGTISLNRDFPKVTILSKTADGDAYKYTTDPILYSLLPKADRFTSYTFSVYFNGILFTNDAKPQWSQGTYFDTAYSYLRMSSSSSNPYYNYYFYAFVDDLDNITNDPAPHARFPGSFGKVGDVITVRIEKN